jgi:hypothetical protein
MSETRKQLAQWGRLDPVKKAINKANTPSWTDQDKAKRSAKEQEKRAEYFKRQCHNLRTSKRWYAGRNERLEQEIKQAKNAETRIMDMWLEARLLALDLKPERQGDRFLVDAEALETLFNFMSVGE